MSTYSDSESNNTDTDDERDPKICQYSSIKEPPKDSFTDS